jgi:hypothetical protein
MEIKKSDTSFIVNIPAMGTNYYQSNNYHLVHPNLDVYTDHIILKNTRRGNSIFIKYVLKNNLKAQYTYNYFKLKELEIDTIKLAQGVKASTLLNSNIPELIRNAFLRLLTRI